MTEEDDYERRFRRGEKRRRIIRPLMWLVLAAVCVSPCVMLAKNVRDRAAEEKAREDASKMGPDDLARLGPLAARAEQRVSPRQAAWAKQVTPEALASLQPGQSRCGQSLQAPTAAAGESYVLHGSIDGNYFGGWSFRLVTAGQSSIESSAIGRASRTIERARQAAAEHSGDKDILARLEAIAEDRYFDEEVDIFVVVESQKEPTFLADTFLSGLLVGRAYLYSHAAERVACAADLKVESSDSIDFSYFKTNPVFEHQDRTKAADSALKRDMEVQTRRAITQGLLALLSPPK